MDLQEDAKSQYVAVTYNHKKKLCQKEHMIIYNSRRLELVSNVMYGISDIFGYLISQLLTSIDIYTIDISGVSYE